VAAIGTRPFWPLAKIRSSGTEAAMSRAMSSRETSSGQMSRRPVMRCSMIGCTPNQ
jgi:hypothetical protein